MSESTVRVFARDGDTEVDITEGVQALYDLVIGSMNWGSGFLSVEEALPVARVARVCRFERSEEAERYVRAQEHDPQQQEFLRQRRERGQRTFNVPHDHVFSTADMCMWPACRATRFGP
jgi:hypothetical protein